MVAATSAAEVAATITSGWWTTASVVAAGVLGELRVVLGEDGTADGRAKSAQVGIGNHQSLRSKGICSH